MRLPFVIVSVGIHAAIMAVVSRAPKEAPKSTVVPVRLTMKAAPKPEPPPPPPPPESPPPKKEAPPKKPPPPNVEPKKVKKVTVERVEPELAAPKAVEEPPKPPTGFSVDMSRTVIGGAGPAVRAVEGGGNMFADPADPLPAGPKTTTPEPSPPGSSAGTGRRDLYQITKKPVFAIDEADRTPPYPESAKRLGVEGVVVLRVYVQEDGRVKDVKVLQGLGSGCDEVSVEWAKTRWKFIPAKAGDTPVGMWITVPVRFVLDR